MHHVVRAASARAGTVVLALGLLVALPAVGSAADPVPTDPRPAVPADAVTADRPDPLLDDPVGGRAALRELGDRLPVAAAVNDLRARELQDELRSDDTARLSTDGRLHYVEPLAADRLEDPAARTVEPAVAAAPLSETFALHSNPGAQRTILIDVDGATVSGTAWNRDYALPAAAHPAWDPAGDGAAFSDGERARVQQIWSMVSEDFAPYDVDVTTQDPGPAGLDRAGATDQVYGVRALVSPSTDAWSRICARQCGGVAYLGVFDAVGSAFQTAWVFPQGLGHDTKAVAEAISHEVGHTLDLQHDGTATAGYYGGHGSWAPIMGVGYDRPITQWSRGDYAGADNQQDDLATIGTYLARRADEPGGAAPQTGHLTSAADRDRFVLGRCTAGSRVTVRSPYATPDLDVRARLLTPGGTVLAVADPPSAAVDRTVATGMDATLTVPADGSYDLDVAASSRGTATDGYTTYGSVGAYRVTATGCDGDQSGLPGSPVGLVESAPATATTVSLGWSPPAATGSSAITEYVVSSGVGDAVRLGPDAREVTLGDLAPSTDHDVSVTAVNARGAGAPATLRLRTTAPVGVPSVPTDVHGSWDAAEEEVELSWQPPASEGGSAVASYEVTYDDSVTFDVPAHHLGVALSGTGISPGEHTLAVAAANATGTGPAATTTVVVPAPDVAAPVVTDLDFTPRTVDVTDGPQQVTVSARLTDASGAEAPTVTLDSDTTDETAGAGPMTRVSGTDQDGRYERVVTLSDDAAAGTWTVTVLPAVDVLGNTDGARVDHPEKLTVVRAAPVTAPDAPTGVTAVAGAGEATVRWAAPSDDGRSPVTGYTVSTGGGHVTTVGASATTATVTGLTNGTPYAFVVTAANAVGSSPSSTPSPPVTPAGPPGRMGRPRAVVRGSAVTVSWEAAADQGSPVTGYTVLVSGERARQVAASRRSVVVKGVDRGRHTVRVAATNALGTSPRGAVTRIRVR